MRLASKGGINWREREAFRWFRLRKRIYQWIRYRPGQDKTIVFIVGCQRSGTSMLSHLFRRDREVFTFDEVSPLSSQDPEGLRLDPLEDVQRIIRGVRAGMVVCKPLVESQNLKQLLDAFPGSKAIWMYRDVGAVARSNLVYFGQDNGRKDLMPLLAGDVRDWRAEHVAVEDVAVVRDMLAGSQDLDAAALFWWLRNRLLFRDDLAADPRVRVVEYDALLADPAAVMAAIYQFLDWPFPGETIVAEVIPRARSRRSDADLKPEIAELCRTLEARYEPLTRWTAGGP